MKYICPTCGQYYFNQKRKIVHSHSDILLSPAIKDLKKSLKAVIQHSVGETIIDSELKELLNIVRQHMPF